MRIASVLTITTVVALSFSASASAQPQYTIVDLGVVNHADTAAQGLGISPGGVAFGRSVGTSNQAFSWTAAGGLVALPKLAGRTFQVANGANDSGRVVGTATSTVFGSSPLPVLWTNGVVSQLALPSGQTAGRANDINANNLAVGSINGGSAERACRWNGNTPSIITATGPGGIYMTTAYRVNDSGLAVGNGIDPQHLARNVGLLYDATNNTLTEIPALAGQNGTIAFDISQTGSVVGVSSFNQSGSLPFIWDSTNGSVAIPLPTDTSMAIARGVNSQGWVVGIGSSAFAIPFLYDGTNTYRLQDLLPANTPWDLSTNTSSSALGISESGTIVGTGIINGLTHAYAMTLVPPPPTCPADFNADGILNADDLGDFITGYFDIPSDPRTDFNADGVINADDLGDFITAYFNGC